MGREKQKLEIGDRVIYPVTETKGRIVEIRKINGKKWALIEPVYVWIELTKLKKIEETKQEDLIHET
ncbi:MAG: DUF2098 family protein [archaeon GB-1867-035]|nr:DUF2098 family protein [Candidatus Culexmicrobium profundum]